MTFRWLNVKTRGQPSPDSVNRFPESAEKPRGGHWNWAWQIASVGLAGLLGPAQVPATAPPDPLGFLTVSRQDRRASLSTVRFQPDFS